MRVLSRRSDGPAFGCASCEELRKVLAHMVALKGVERLSGTSKSNSGRSASSAGAHDKKARKDRRGTVGRALRTVYDDMLREDVPPDFLDLLKKLD
jgi:hypothetical protein